MHPALSVVLFTALAGSGFGLLGLLGARLALGPPLGERAEPTALLVLGLLLASAGLLASLAHLGQPQRAWRALSQWRSSWLSREGVAALATYLPALLVALMLWNGGPPWLLRTAGAALLVLALATVWCTARIYTSLLPIPAWTDRRVLPGYLLFAGLGGALWYATTSAWLGGAAASVAALVAVLAALAAIRLKQRYWSAIDQQRLPVDLRSATGLPHAHGMRALEAPHTEANYLLREMGFVLARRHGARLRRIVQRLLVGTALLAAGAALLDGTAAALTATLALLAGQLAILVERWLFFAQACHVVTLYYGATGDPARVAQHAEP